MHMWWHRSPECNAKLFQRLFSSVSSSYCSCSPCQFQLIHHISSHSECLVAFSAGFSSFSLFPDFYQLLKATMPPSLPSPTFFLLLPPLCPPACVSPRYCFASSFKVIHPVFPLKLFSSLLSSEEPHLTGLGVVGLSRGECFSRVVGWFWFGSLLGSIYTERKHDEVLKW